MPDIDSLVVDPATAFDEHYYRTGLGPRPYDRNNIELLEFFGRIADEMIRAVQPRSVFDAGCAMGFLVESLWDRNVPAKGIDVSSYAISQVRRDMQPHCTVASLEEPIVGSYDLVTCIEVVEHMPWSAAQKAIENLTKAADVILFSSSPDDLVEETHVNVNPPIVWIEEFSRFGFYPDLVFDASFVAPQTFLLRRCAQPIDLSVLRLFADLVRRKVRISKLDTVLAATYRENHRLQSENQALDSAVTSVRNNHLEILALVQQLRDSIDNSQTNGNSAPQTAVSADQYLPLKSFLSSLVERSSRAAETQNALLVAVNEAVEVHAHKLQSLDQTVQLLDRRINELGESQRQTSLPEKIDESDMGLASLDTGNAKLQGVVREATEEVRGELAVLRHQILGLATRTEKNSAADLTATLDELRAEVTENRQAIGQLVRLTTGLHDQIQEVTQQVHNLLHGRIWRTLSKNGRFFLKLLGKPVE